MKALADWQKENGVGIVYPIHLDGRKYLTGYFNDFIKSLPKLHLLIITNEKLNDNDKNRVKNLNHDVDYAFHVNNELADIWIRDWAPFVTDDKFCKFKYDPSYFKEKDKDYSIIDDLAGSWLITQINKSDSESDLKLDGGNFTTNGNGVAIVSNKLIGDNENYSFSQIKDEFKTKLGINELVFVPVEYGDATGHVDGLVRFVNENVLLVSSYKATEAEAKIFTDELVKYLKYELKTIIPDLKIVRLENAMNIIKVEKENIGSADGNYINFLRYRDIILLPQYGGEHKDADKKALNDLEEFKSLMNVNKIIPLISNHLMKLASLGGIINCTTWQW